MRDDGWDTNEYLARLPPERWRQAPMRVWRAEPPERIETAFRIPIPLDTVQAYGMTTLSPEDSVFPTPDGASRTLHRWFRFLAVLAVVFGVLTFALLGWFAAGFLQVLKEMTK